MTFTSGTQWLQKFVKYKLKRNQSILALWVGETGTGKSYSAISCAIKIDPSFNVDRIVFDTKSFLHLINSGLPKGSVIIYDDAGLGISNKDWYNEQVKVFGKVVQSYRVKQIITFITTPDISFIENQSRTLLNLLMQSDPIEQGTFYPKKPYKPRNYTLKSGNTYYVYPRFFRRDRYGNVEKVVVSKIHFPLPPNDIIKEYEEKKRAFIDKFYYDAETKLADDEKPKPKRKMNPNSLANLLNYKKPEATSETISETIP
jgi:hypothetical protein